MKRHRDRPALLDGNDTYDRLTEANRTALEAIAAERPRFASGELTHRDFARMKQEQPYFGYVPCRAAGLDFVLFHAHDDVIAWEYLWLGDDAFEGPIVHTWVDWARTSSLVYDVGAYTGLMSVLAVRANPAARVHLFEPVDRTVERAKINVRSNGVGNRVTLHNQAASDRAGTVEMNLYRDEDFLGTGNSIYHKDLPVRAVRTITTVAVDELLPQGAPDLVKVDVEGHELQTLIGLARSIERGRPRMILECWEHTRAEVLGLLDDWGYTYTPFERAELPVMNYACVPAERAAEPAGAAAVAPGRAGRWRRRRG